MDSMLLRAAARVVVPFQFLFSVFLLLRGHNEPGGGFAGGLVAAIALAVDALAHGSRSFLGVRPWVPRVLIGAGLLVATCSGVLALVAGLPYMTGLWGGSFPSLVAGEVKLGTPVLFDVGVYLLVAGMGAQVVAVLLEEDR